MPIDYKLIVKEHPVAKSRSWRSVETYQKIMEIPRVKLLHPDVKIQEIIKKIVSLRFEKSQLLGFKDHAEKTLQKRMAQNTETVMKFLNIMA